MRWGRKKGAWACLRIRIQNVDTRLSLLTSARWGLLTREAVLIIGRGPRPECPQHAHKDLFLLVAGLVPFRHAAF